MLGCEPEASQRTEPHLRTHLRTCETWAKFLQRGYRELALDIPKIGLVPAFGHLAINKSAAGMDVEANLPPRSAYAHELFSRVGCADIQIYFYDVVSLEAHSGDRNMFIGNRCIHLSPKNLKPFWPAWVSDRFQFMKPGIRGHDAIDASRIWRDDRLGEAQVVSEESRLRRIGSQNSSDCRT
jgi:hypothetical protein